MIGADVTVTGNIEATDDLVIEGRVNGDVKCSTLIIGENGRVLGNVEAERLRLSGQVEGTIVTGDLAIESGAKISGEIAYSRLRVASGGIIDGQMTQRGDGGGSRGDMLDIKDSDPAPQRMMPANGVGNGTVDAYPTEAVAVYEDSSYRDGLRATGNGPG